MNRNADRSTWWSRNWKWFVPTGCLTVLILFVGSIVLFIGFIFGMMKQTGAYTEAMAIAKANPQVIAAIGTPIQEGYLMSGNFNENGPSGSAEYSIPLTGPRGSGTLYVEAKKSAGRWSFNTLVFESAATQARIDLLGSGSTPIPAPELEREDAENPP